MTITVFHLDDEKISYDDRLELLMSGVTRTNEALVKRFWLAGGYSPVATIETDSLSTAWELTNNIDERWVDNREIVDLHGPVDPFGRRSSMVNDIMSRDGVFYIVQSVGFGEIELSERQE